jgi:hypothetical protein
MVHEVNYSVMKVTRLKLQLGVREGVFVSVNLILLLQINRIKFIHIFIFVVCKQNVLTCHADKKKAAQLPFAMMVYRLIRAQTDMSIHKSN